VPYGREVDHQVAPITAAELERHLGLTTIEDLGTADRVFDVIPGPQEGEEYPKPKRSRAAVALACAAGLLALGLVVLTDQNGDDDVTDPATSPTAAVQPVPPPTAVEPVIWTPGDAEHDPPTTVVETVIPTTVVAEPEPPLEAVDAFGHRWTRLPSDQIDGSEQCCGRVMGDVTVGGPRLVAVGAPPPVAPMGQKACVSDTDHSLFPAPPVGDPSP
jgi:hypothetical protein